jgi:putative peptidoglycan lipid II flippase
VPRLGVVGLALAGAASAWCNVVALYVILARRGFYHLTPLVLSRILRISGAAAFMGTILWYALPYGTEWYSGSALERVAAIAALVALGGVAFFGAAFVLKAVDRKTIDQLRRRPA